MNTHTDDREQRLNQLLLTYIEAQQVGQAPALGKLLIDHPEFADELIEFVAGRKQLNRLAGCLHGHPTPGRLHAPTEAPGLWSPAAGAERGVIGDFRILREIGRGGMGYVYEAEQLSLQRQVALKVLPFAAALDPKQLQRFKHEAQAAAHLHHTNIVPVYAVGTDRGYHYYAMQYIEGQSLAAVLQSLRQQAEPRPAMATMQPRRPAEPAPVTAVATAFSTVRDTDRRAYFARVADLGQKAADALEHAHQLGVIHRDIKPGNLLWDVRGHLWITDFGLALFQDQAGLTITGELLGTLRYMSPEQAAGRRTVIDHRTDIYSLGATLYELLTLEPVVDGEGRHELLARIAQGQPKPPRAIDPAIPVELETIVLKALAEQPGDRYATAQEFAADLRRFLEDRPILARRPTLLDRARKWGRRNKTLVASAVVLLVLATVGLLVSTVLIAAEATKATNAAALAEAEARKARDAYERERLKAKEAEEQRARADQSFRQALKAVHFFRKVSEEDLANQPFSQGVRKKLLEAALDYYQAFIEERGSDPTLEKELADSRSHARKLLGELSSLQSSGQFQLLKEPAVHDDLKLSPEQRELVQALVEQQKDQWENLFPKSRMLQPQERDRLLLEWVRKGEQAVADVLTPTQAKRLGQILVQLQQRGPNGFTDPSLLESLKLTAAQKAKVRKLQDEAFQEVLPLLDQGKGKQKFMPPMEMHRKTNVVWERVQDSVLALLTPAQLTRWRDLAGETFRGELRSTTAFGFGPPFSGPFGQGGPPGPHGPPHETKGGRKEPPPR